LTKQQPVTPEQQQSDAMGMPMPSMQPEELYPHMKWLVFWNIWQGR